MSCKGAFGNRQAVALNSFLEVVILQGIFIKIPCKITTSKKLFKATACRLPKAPLQLTNYQRVSFSLTAMVCNFDAI